MKVNENYQDLRGSVALKYNHHCSTSNHFQINFSKKKIYNLICN